MRGMILTTLLWLIGTVPAHAQAWMQQPETLRYDVSLGPVSMGKAVLEYRPDAGGRYVFGARVKDGVPFLTLDDSWTASGTHAAGKPFQTVTYRAVQRENDYRADKLLTFDRVAKTVVYENFHGREPSMTVPLPVGLRDILSAVFALRAEGLEAAKVARVRDVIGLKRVFPLKVAAAVPEKVSVGGKSVQAYKVVMKAENAAKIRTDTMIVWVLPDASLKPVRIQALLSFGTLTASLRE